MARLKDPLFGEEARGIITKAALFKRSRVHPVFTVCAYHPINWTTQKIAQAQAWKALCNSWRALSQKDKDRWNSLAPGVLTGFNYYMQHKGVPPFPPPYEPPAGDNILFNFTETGYTAPQGDQLTFTF